MGFPNQKLGKALLDETAGPQFGSTRREIQALGEPPEHILAQKEQHAQLGVAAVQQLLAQQFRAARFGNVTHHLRSGLRAFEGPDSPRRFSKRVQDQGR